MEHKGTVYFFIGLSGTGKTTVGSLFYQRFKNTKPNTVHPDGDETRAALGGDVGYVNDECPRWAGRIFRVCRLLSDQGIDVVYCSIAMFDIVRRWNQEHIPDYKEIYIRIKKETPIQRNQKGPHAGRRNVVGMDLPLDEPQSPDFVLQNDGKRIPLELIEEIEGVPYPNIAGHPIDNTDYWSLYYQNKLYPTNPSPFARYVSTLAESGWTLAELECGSGQDALYFAPLGLDVVATDLSEAAIGMLWQQPAPHARFICGDFVSHTLHQSESYDYTYSRFTIHAINQKRGRMLLGSMTRALKLSGKFFIEVRNVHNPLYGGKEALERSTPFYNNHYRRFLMLDKLTEALRQTGSRIGYVREQTSFTPYSNNDPSAIRVVAAKN